MTPPGEACRLPRRGTVAASIALIGLLLVALPAGAQADDSWQDVEPQPVRENVPVPVDLEIAPDGRLWWNAFDTGNVTSWKPGQEPRVHFHADPYETPIERGLVGLELAPDRGNETFYVYYTVPNPDDPERETNHLSLVEDGDETRLLELPGHKRHNGGAIERDENGRLFVAVGDNDQGYPAQNLSKPIGKVLHLDPDGSPANDTIEGPIYSLGHRNPFGLAYDEDTGHLFATENSAQRRDEVNLIERGANYGWPHCQGSLRYDPDQRQQLDDPCPDEYQDPIGEFYHNRTAAPTGIAVHDGVVYWGALNQGEIHRLVFTEDGEWVDTVVLETDSQILDIESYEGDLYFTDWSTIYRIEDPPQPPMANIPFQQVVDEEPGGTSSVPFPGLAGLLGLAGALAVRGCRR